MEPTIREGWVQQRQAGGGGTWLKRWSDLSPSRHRPVIPVRRLVVRKTSFSFAAAPTVRVTRPAFGRVLTPWQEKRGSWTTLALTGTTISTPRKDKWGKDVRAPRICLC